MNSAVCETVMPRSVTWDIESSDGKEQSEVSGGTNNEICPGGREVCRVND